MSVNWLKYLGVVGLLSSKNYRVLVEICCKVRLLLIVAIHLLWPCLPRQTICCICTSCTWSVLDGKAEWLRIRAQ